MPAGDGTGPQGMGPTGWQMGPCGGGTGRRVNGFVGGRGGGRGYGRGFGRGYGRGNFGPANDPQMNDVQGQLADIRDAIAQLKNNGGGQ